MASKPTAGTILVSAAETSSQAAAVFRMTPKKGTATKIFAGGDLVTPVGITIDAKGGIVVADADAFGGKGGVIRVDPLTGKATKVSSGELFSNPFDVAVEKDGSILVADPHASGTGGVIRVDPKTGQQTMFSSGQESGSAPALREVGLALEADGAILVVEQGLSGGSMGTGRLTRIDPVTGKRKVVAHGRRVLQSCRRGCRG